MTDALHDGDVAIGDERDFLGFFCPEIVVLHNHQLVTATEFILTVEHLITDALIIDIGPLVAASDHDGLICPHPIIARGESVDKFAAWHHLDVSEPCKADLRQLRHLIVGNHLTDLRGIPKNARLLSLSKYLVQVTFIDTHTIAAQHIGHQRRTLVFAYWRQLSLVADEQHTTVRATTRLIDEGHQVVEQATAPESKVAIALIGNHRGLIYYK